MTNIMRAIFELLLQSEHIICPCSRNEGVAQWRIANGYVWEGVSFWESCTDWDGCKSQVHNSSDLEKVGRSLIDHCASFPEVVLSEANGIFHFVAHECLVTVADVKYQVVWSTEKRE